MSPRMLAPMLGIVSILALSSCTLLNQPDEVTPDPELVAWLDAYCGLDSAVPQEVRDAFTPESIPAEATEADREPLVPLLTSLDEALAAVGTAASELPPAPEGVGPDPAGEVIADVEHWREINASNMAIIPDADLSQLDTMYGSGETILNQLRPEVTFANLRGYTMPSGTTRLAMEQAPACAPAIEHIEDTLGT